MDFRFLVFFVALAFCQGQDHEGHGMGDADHLQITSPQGEMHHVATDAAKFTIVCHCHHRDTISWSKDGKALTKGGRYNIVVSDLPNDMRDSTLTVSGEMSKADNGHYRCTTGDGGDDEVHIMIGDHSSMSSATTSGVSVVLATATLLAAALLR